MGKTKTVGKDREGKYHPPKGKPSGIDKEEGLGLQPTSPDKLEEYLDITDKYTTGEDQLADNLPLRHPNRNVNKRNDALRENTHKDKQQSEESNKSKNETFAEPLSNTVAEELPELLSKDILAQLKAFSSECCISVYIPTHASGMEVNEGQDATRFKTALQQTVQELSSRGIDEGRIKRWLKPAYDLYRDDNFWKQQSKGLALFISKDYCRYLRMRIEPVEKIYINSNFSLAPLAGLLVNPDYFYFLMISKRQAKLFRADNYGMHLVPVENLPGHDQTPSLPDEAETGDTDSNFYGISASQTDTALYFKTVNDVLKEAVLKNEHVPLLLAGVDAVTAAYRSISDYPHIWETTLSGNHEKENTTRLYELSRSMMQPYFDQRLNKALDLYGNRSASALTSYNLAEIIPAAYYGRVSHLFIANQDPVWGHFDKEKNELTMDPDNNSQGREDLIDETVTHTLLTGGEVHFLEKEEMPADSVIAAILRY